VIYVTTKAGRRLPDQRVEGYTRENLSAWVDRSLRNLATEAIDLLQLHCPPSALYRDPGVYALLDEMVSAGKVRHYGVSVETVDEALEAIRHPGVKTVQIIFNMFRLKPAELFFPAARAANVGILARVPLASGLLTGKLNARSTFAPDDHRQFNRNGEQFDKGETFSGVPYDAGLDAVEALKPLVPAGATLAQCALRWILMFDAVTCAIPGARTPDQARSNASAAELPALDQRTMDAVRHVYDTKIREHVHAAW
jgi:aryl-alcohol dehydrogenase-like predicted oxidoreductase